jgi:hypothetical protein
MYREIAINKYKIKQFKYIEGERHHGETKKSK